jgi:hypothetical protein
MNKVLELMPRRSQAKLEFLNVALQPFGKLKVRDVRLAIATKYCVPGSKIANEPQHVEHGALSRPIMTTQYHKRLKSGFESHETTEIVNIEPGDHVAVLQACSLPGSFACCVKVFTYSIYPIRGHMLQVRLVK